MSSLCETNRVFVMAAYPDDEVLDCGGSIACYADVGDQMKLSITPEGASSFHQQRDRIQVSENLSGLAQAVQISGSICGVVDVGLLDLPANRLGSLNYVNRIEERIDRHQPQVAYVHHAGDVNVDQRRLHEAVITFCRITLGHPLSLLLGIEMAISNEWKPQVFPLNWFMDISDYLACKLEALVVYTSDVFPWLPARCLQKAEAFRLLWQLV